MELFKRFEGIIDRSGPEAALLAQVDPMRLPRHVAIIMDGNGRWARRRGLPRVEGHRAGTDSVKAAVEYAARLGIPYLTLYAFSTENWKRPVDEVNTLWSLLRTYLNRELSTLQEYDIRFRPIGRLSELPRRAQEELKRAEKLTAGNSRMDLVVALSYSGRLELVDAINRMLKRGVRAPVTADDIERNLYTAGIPDPDLMIRTSGEMRVSNFLLWQIAYSEIHVLEVLWPDFRGNHFLEAVIDFQSRERRYGGVLSTSGQPAT
jgi:undecaprenyl diphosphate synthase